MASAILKRFTVAGRDAFPHDLLRVDQCWPAAPGDAAAIAGTPEPRRAITLETAAKYAPNRQRWRAVGWPVVD